MAEHTETQGSQMNKIAQILLSPRVGGAETLAASLEQEWAVRGVQSKVIYLDPDGMRNSRLRRVTRLRASLTEFKPEAVIAHSYLPALYARLVWGGRGPVHSVLHSASDDFASARSRHIEQALGARTASVIAVSESQANEYRKRFPHVRVTRIANGVRRDITVKSTFAREPRTIVTVARVAEQKRPEFWNAVATEMFKRRPQMHFEWWGPLSGQGAIDRSVLNATPSARHMGSTSDLANVLASSDIMFHPSSREAHSIVLLEAAVAGIPVVYADSITRPDTNTAWDLRYQVDDVSNAVHALERVIENWPAVAANSLKFGPAARAEYGASTTADQYLSWLEPK